MEFTLPGGLVVPLAIWLPILLAIVVVGWTLAVAQRHARSDRANSQRVVELERALVQQRAAVEAVKQQRDAELGLEPIRKESVHHALAQAAAIVRDLGRARQQEEFVASLSRHIQRLLNPAQWMILVATGTDPLELEMAASGTELGGAVWPVGRRLPADAGRIGLLLKRGRYLDAEVFEEATSRAQNRALDSEPEVFRIDAAVTVVVMDQVRAVITVGGTDSRLHDPRTALEFLSDCASDALERVDAERRRLAAERHDELTGLFNKSFFSAQASEVCYQNRARGVWTTVVLIGVDDFRGFVGAHGHLAADQLLRSLAERVRAGVPTLAMVCRWSTDEIIVSLSDAHPAVAERLAARLLRDVAEQSWGADEEGDRKPVSVSIGIASTSGGERTFDDVVESAMGHLAAARWGGGNQVVVGGGHGIESDEDVSFEHRQAEDAATEFASSNEPDDPA